MAKKWIINNDHADVSDLACELGMPSLLVRLLARRGMTDYAKVQRFLEPKEDQLYDPFMLKDMDKAVGLLDIAVDNKSNIMIFGDYDVDGVSSVAMMSKYLTTRGAKHFTILPQRHVNGYDFNDDALEQAKANDVKLIMCLDCGSNSELLLKVPSMGIDVVVIDHHEVTEEDRDFVLVNPKRTDASYPFRDLTTGALVFKFISACEGKAAFDYIDLAALSVVCDVAPLLDENRIIVRKGLEKLRSFPSLGLKVLMQVTKVNPAYVSTFHLGWRLGPRLNAAGRISRADLSLELLMAEDEKKAYDIACEIEGVNKQRKQISDSVREMAMTQLEDRHCDDDYIHVAYGEDWNAGIVGIVASNIKEKYYRPAIVISFDGDTGKGSGRSIHGFNILEALESCKDYLETFGGHARACGIEIKKDKIEEFRLVINEYAKKHLESKELIPVIYVDADVSFFDLTDATVQALSGFAPFGEGNQEPLFMTHNVFVKNITNSMYGQKQIWLEERSIKGNRVLPARVFKNSPFIELLPIGTRCDITYSVTYDVRNSGGPITLKIKDVKVL